MALRADHAGEEAHVTVSVRPSATIDELAEPAAELAIETPFLEVQETPLSSGWSDTPGEAAPETPFVTEYLVGDEIVGPATGAFRELLGELYDQEFDETLLELVDEADAHAELLGTGETEADRIRTERTMQQWIEPLRVEAEMLLESMGSALDAANAQELSEHELDELLDRFEPTEPMAAPVFEDFLKKLWKKAKSVAKGAVKLAKKGVAAIGKILPIGIILKKIKALVRPLLQRVLKIALNRLPPALRPAATQLARRLFGVKEVDEEAEDLEGAEAPASVDVRELQAELDAEITTLLLAPDEPQQEGLLAEVAYEAQAVEDASLAELDEARNTFVERLGALQDGEDPTPVVEQFLPAVLPVLRMGIGVIGRTKVVKFLAKLLGRLIAPYVGPQLTPPLSRAIVDAGLRLMTLEAGEELEDPADPRIAAEAFAGAVEDTVAALGELDEEELDDEHVLEEVTLEAFHRAARSHFPAGVLKGAGGPAVSGTWVARPRRGPKRYRKYSRVLDVTIQPDVAAAIRTRGGRSLATVLRDRLDQAGPVAAKVHLYQAIPGTRLGRIARGERGIQGLGSGTMREQEELLPLTREAAGVLLGEPELGRDVSEAYLGETAPPAIGQRFFFMEVAGGRPAATPAAQGGGATRPMLSGVTAAIDLRANELRFAIYLSEAQAQEIATRLRRKEPIGSALGALRRIYGDGIGALTTGARPRIRVVGEAPDDGHLAGEQFLRLPATLSPRKLAARLLRRWVRMALAAELDRQRDAFVEAASAPADGVTLMVKIERPPGLAVLARVLKGGFGAGPGAFAGLPALLKQRSPKASVQAVAGRHRA